MRLGRARILAAMAAITTLAGVFAAAAIPAASATTAVPAIPAATAVSGASVSLPASAAAPLPDGAARVGATPAQTRVTIDVALNLGNPAGLNALVNGLGNKKSPYFRHFLAKGQFGPEFGLGLAQIAQVTSALRALGLNPGPVDAARLDIPVTATAAALDRAFRTTLTDYRLPGGRIAYANSAAPRLPASVAPYIEGVLGLDDVYLPQHLSARETTPAATADGPVVSRTAVASSAATNGPKPCTKATDTAVDFGGYTADELATHYLMKSLYKMGDLGQGVHVAVAELEPNLTSDITAYEACYGIHTKVNYITVSTPGVGKGDGSGEAALDIENIAGIAPDATIDVYQQPNSLTALLDVAQKVLDKDSDQVLSISYGLCESLSESALLTHYQTVFKGLNAQGITVLAGAGDYGPAGCYNGGKTKAPDLSPDSPASANYVLAVGGTGMENATPLSPERAWNGQGGANGAGGGGLSALCMPSYQDYNQTGPTWPAITGLISKYSKTYTPCKNPSGDKHGYQRQVPDLSADAGGGSPYIVYYDNAWDAFYGTSGATSLVAAEAALIDASPFCGPKGWNSGAAGLLPQELYAIVSSNNLNIYLSPSSPNIVRDVTAGNTDDKASGYTGGKYPATKGYDLATGLGTPLLTNVSLPAFYPGMAMDMCFQNTPTTISTTSVYPNHARAGKPVNVTVHGTGFLEIPNSDTADINNHNNLNEVTQVWANCTSHTTCTVTIPAEKAGTYQVEMIIASFLPCNTCKAYVTFHFTAAKGISTMSADGGAASAAASAAASRRGSGFTGVSAGRFAY